MTEITNEQRAAVDWLLGVALGGYSPAEVDHAAALLAALPSELTNPQPVLPTEPGAYHDARGTLTIIDPRGKWHGTYGDIINPDLCPGPFTRLVPERPQIDQAALYREAVSVARLEMKSYGPVTTGVPESLWDETSDMPESVARKVSQVYLSALVNGADRD